MGLLDEEGAWTLNAVTDERISHEDLRKFLAPIVEKTAGEFVPADSTAGFATAYHKEIATIVGPDSEGELSFFWLDCGTDPSPVPNECADLVYLCNGHPETQISIHISSMRPDGVYLSTPEARGSLEKMERALVNVAGILAHRWPSLVFYDGSEAIYSSGEMKALSIAGKSRDDSWGYRLGQARSLRDAQDSKLQAEAFKNELEARFGKLQAK
ncbi:MAG TPA: hypothetical protein VGZ00_03605 [Candidatus Baltobacteraceae bacterium]|nr:hypothetical protein [Candidatus Baltobacteraceae bacterium]